MTSTRTREALVAPVNPAPKKRHTVGIVLTILAVVTAIVVGILLVAHSRSTSGTPAAQPPVSQVRLPDHTPVTPVGPQRPTSKTALVDWVKYLEYNYSKALTKGDTSALEQYYVPDANFVTLSGDVMDARYVAEQRMVPVSPATYVSRFQIVGKVYISDQSNLGSDTIQTFKATFQDKAVGHATLSEYRNTYVWSDSLQSWQVQTQVQEA